MTTGIDPRDLRVGAVTPLHDLGLHHRNGDCDEQGCRRVVVIDPEDPKQIQQILDKLRTFGYPGDATVTDRWQMALREIANPKPYREYAGPARPWPLVAECHSRHVDGHECPQCAWKHEHDWVAWIEPRGPEWPPGSVPVRCSKCGGRKCDQDLCPKQRHDGHSHQDGE